MTSEQTPSEWLLAEHDRKAAGPLRDQTTGRRRGMFHLLDDHPPADCATQTDSFGNCLSWSGRQQYIARDNPQRNPS